MLFKCKTRCLKLNNTLLRLSMLRILRKEKQGFLAKGNEPHDKPFLFLLSQLISYPVETELRNEKSREKEWESW